MPRSKAKYPTLMSSNDVSTAADLLKARFEHLARLEVARRRGPLAEEGPLSKGGVLGITLYGRYQDEAFVDYVRPVVCDKIIEQIHEVDRRLLAIGVRPDPIPADPFAEEPMNG